MSAAKVRQTVHGHLARAHLCRTRGRTVVGDVVVLRCTVADFVDTGRGSEVLRMPMTQVWIRADAQWVCLAGHAGPRLAPE